MKHSIKCIVWVVVVSNLSNLYAGKTQSCFKKTQPPQVIQTDLTERSEYTTWMADMARQIATVPLNRVVLPGTHDAGTCDITEESKFIPNITQEPFLKDLIKAHEALFSKSSLVRRIAAKWAKAQPTSIAQQLVDGIRYFDLRPGYDDEDDRFKIHHGLFSTNIDDVLQAFKEFTEQYPQEIIVISFKIFVNMDQDKHARLIHDVSTVLGDCLISRKKISTTSTLQDIWNTKKQIVCLYGDNNYLKNDYLWSYNTIHTVWPNTTDLSIFKQKLTEALTQRPESDANFFDLGCSLTPQIETIVKGQAGEIFGVLLPGRTNAIDSLEELAEQANPTVVKLIDTWRNQGVLSKVNIISIDWYTNFDFVALVQRINMERAKK